MKRIVIWLLSIAFIYSCQSPGNKTVAADKTKSTTNELPDLLIIAPIYPDTVYFVIQSVTKNQTIVRGNVESFHNKTSETHELYFQRFVEKQGTYRIIHCAGTGLEKINEFGKEQNSVNKFNDTIKFDELGIFDGEPGDPVDLIPLYPGHTVKPGEYWRPEAKVKIPMGYGMAKYSFVVDSIYKDEGGSVLARMQIKVNGNLQPSPEFQGGNVTVSGGGWIVWDCTINQRRKTHLTATYLAIKEQSEVKQFIRVDDELQVKEGRNEF